MRMEDAPGKAISTVNHQLMSALLSKSSRSWQLALQLQMCWSATLEPGNRIQYGGCSKSRTGDDRLSKHTLQINIYLDTAAEDIALVRF